MKFGRKAEGSFTDSRERTADTLVSDLESVASVVEGSDLKEKFVPTAKLSSRHRGKATGDQIRSSMNTLLCMPSPSRTGDDCACFCSTVFFKTALGDVSAEQHTKFDIRQD